MKARDRNPPRETSLRRAATLLPRFILMSQMPLIFAGGYVVIMAAVAFSSHHIGDYAVETDFYWAYAPHAKQLLSGNIIVDQFKGPGYEMVLAAFSSATADLFGAGMAISLLSAGIVLFLTYKLVTKLFNPEAGFLTSLVMATNHIFLVSSYTASTDMFFNLLAVLVLYLLLSSGEFRLKNIAAAGAVAGFAYITRYNAVSFFLAGILGILFLNFGRTDWRRRLLATAVFLGSALPFIVLWGIYCRSQTGSFFYNNNYLNIAYEMFGKGKMSWDQYCYAYASQFHSYFDVLAHDPYGFLTQIAINSADHFWSDLSLLMGLPVGIFAIGGILALAIRRIDRRQMMFFVFACTFYLILLPVFYGERFSLYLIAPLALLAVSFFQWDKFPSPGFPSFGLKHLLLTGIIVVSATLSFRHVNTEIGSGPAEILQIRDVFLQNPANSRPGQRVVARKPHIAYYLNMEFIPFPYVETLDDLLAQSRSSGATHLFYSAIEAGLRPQFRYLLDPRRAPPGLRPIVQTSYPPSVLYELTKE